MSEEQFRLIRLGAPQFFFVHHSSTPNTVQASALINNSLWWLTPARKDYWKRQGYYADYHFYIPRNGSIVLGQPTQMNSCNTGHDYFNNRSIACCLIGNFQNEKPSEEQMMTLKRIGRFYRNKFNITFKKHSDAINTLCPGRYFDWRDFMDGIERKVVLLQTMNEYAVINGKTEKLAIYPFVVNHKGAGHTVAPLRALAEALGAKVSWLPNTKQIKIEL